MELFKYIPFLFLFGCASTSRDCNSSMSQTFGSDWIIVQYSFDGKPINCWNLSNAAVSNESASDGVFWQDPKTKNLVHISGWYSRVQISGGATESAAAVLGVDLDKCGNGRYPMPK